MDETQELVSPNHYLFFSSTLLFSQKNELSFSVGGIPTSDQRTAISLLFPCPFPLPPNCNIFNTQLQTDPGVALQVAYTRHVVSFGPASLYAEFPLVGVLSRDIRAFFTAGPLLGNSFTVSSSALFFTPSARLKLFDSAPISAFVSVGGGLAHTGVGSTLSALVGPSSTSQNSGALQFGGGLDFRTPVRRLGLRAELRDFYCGSGVQPSSTTTPSPGRLHHVFVGGGAFLRF